MSRTTERTRVASSTCAFLGGGGWPPFLRAASFVPAAAMVLFVGFVTGAFT